MNPLFNARTSVEQVESGLLLAPKFDANGLIPIDLIQAIDLRICNTILIPQIFQKEIK